MVEWIQGLWQGILAVGIEKVLGPVVAAMIGTARGFRVKVATPLLYAIIGGGIVYVCLWLSAQTDRYMEAQNTLERLANEQRTVLADLAKSSPTRPYFAQGSGIIKDSGSRQIYLTVSVQNNAIRANNVVSHLLVLPAILDPKQKPIHSHREESANPVGRNGMYRHHWGPVQVKPNSQPAFVVFQIQYIDAMSKEKYAQALFLRFQGVSQDGKYIEPLLSG